MKASTTENSAGEVAGNTAPLSNTTAKDTPAETSGVAATRPSLSPVTETADAAAIKAEHGSSNAEARRRGTFKKATDPSGRVYYWDV